MDDISQTFNTVTPVVYGGTGAPDAAAARTNLGLAINTDIAGIQASSGLLFGLDLSNNLTDSNNDIDISAGVCVDKTGTAVMILASALTKRVDAGWVVGSGNGGLDTGAVSANATYHVHAIKRPDTGVVDVLFSLSPSSPTLPAGYTVSRRIGSLVRASGGFRQFFQNGDTFILDGPTSDISTSALDTTSALFTLASIPSDIQVESILFGQMNSTSANTTVYVNSPQQTSVASTGPYITARQQVANIPMTFSTRIFTNIARQIRAVSSAPSTTLTVTVNGWVDTRGRT